MNKRSITTKDQMNFEISFYEGVVRQKPNYVEALIPLAEAYTRKGLHEKGLEIDRRLARILKDDPVVHYNLACSYALLEKKAESLKALRRAIRLGYCDLEHLKNDSDLKCLHTEPAFQKILGNLCT